MKRVKYQTVRVNRQRHIVKMVSSLCICLLSITTLLGLALNRQHAGAEGICKQADTLYSVQFGDTLSSIAERYKTDWQQLQTYNHIVNADLIFPFESICIPSSGSNTHTTTTNLNFTANFTTTFTQTSNLYPLDQCTWWANQRYHDLHNEVFVPWTQNANAYQWVARALDFHWHVSKQAQVGDIIVLQPGVQGASADFGHVGVVETVNQDGSVLVSSKNWGFTVQEKQNVSYMLFQPGPGVDFIRQF